ncbi:hypothetical protein Tco_1107858 [Tanacetum coccineum]
MHNNIMAVGPYTPSTITIPAVPATDNTLVVPERTAVETILNMSPENKAHYESEKEAIHLLLTGIGDEIYSMVDACKIAHEIWIAIARLQQGKDIAKPITPPSKSAFEKGSDLEQAQRDKDMQKNLALIENSSHSLSFDSLAGSDPSPIFCLFELSSPSSSSALLFELPATTLGTVSSLSIRVKVFTLFTVASNRTLISSKEYPLNCCSITLAVSEKVNAAESLLVVSTEVKIDQGVGSTSGIRACALRNFDLGVMELESRKLIKEEEDIQANMALMAFSDSDVVREEENLRKLEVNNDRFKSLKSGVSVMRMKRSVRYAEMYKSQKPRGNQRNWNNLKSHQLGSDFVMIKKALWKNTRRVNDYYSTRMTHSNSRRNMIPQAVLIRSGIKAVNTAKPKDAHNVVKRNWFHNVKASACWVWRPKQKEILDNVSKHNSASMILKRLDYIDVQGRFNYYCWFKITAVGEKVNAADSLLVVSTEVNAN